MFVAAGRVRVLCVCVRACTCVCLNRVQSVLMVIKEQAPVHLWTPSPVNLFNGVKEQLHLFQHFLSHQLVH